MNPTQSTRRQLLGLGAASLGALALARVAQAQTATKNAPITNLPPTDQPMMPPTDQPMMAPEKMMMTPSASDAELLRSALLVEQVGAAFYAQVLGAQERRSFLLPRAVATATQMAQVKSAHVTAISGVLADMSVTPGFKFPAPAFVSPIGMTWLGYTLEEIAIGAHLNALETLNSRSLRGVVAGIIGADSGHAALLRTLGGTQFSPRYYEAKLSPAQVEMYLGAYRA